MSIDDESATEAGSSTRRAVGWFVVVLSVVYAFTIHNGLGVAPNDNPTTWWHATGFLIDYETVGDWIVEEMEDEVDGELVIRRSFWSPGILFLSLPSLLMAIAVFFLTPSGIARAIACASMMSVPLFAFYGFTGARQVWDFFHWRASIVFVATGLALGCTIAAPSLARGWLRQRAWLQALLYIPVFVAIVSLVRHATGTDEKLFFNFSPWPAIPVLGLEIGAYTLIGILWGVGLALLGLAYRSEAPRLALLGVVLGLIAPAVWFSQRFGANTTACIALPLIAAACIAFTAATTRKSQLPQRALAVLVGASLAFLPLATGRALATGDYVINKFVRSQALIDALQSYYAQSDEGYPDDLQQLIDAGLIDEIPRPRLGFDLFYQLGWLERPDFFYQSLGSSYVLEFTSTEWVQCAYNPPWEDEDQYMEDEEGWEEEEGEYADDSDDAWSCPDKRPELW